MSRMPIHPVETMVADMHEDDAWIIRAAYTGRGVPAGCDGLRLRANKPFRKVSTFEQGCANYVWRMLCFDCAGFGKHVCMPVCADFDLYEACDIQYGCPDRGDREGYDERRRRVRELMKSLDALIMQAESELPGMALKGVMRWGHALGMI